MDRKLVHRRMSSTERPPITDERAAERVHKILAEAVSHSIHARRRVLNILRLAPGEQADVIGHIHPDYSGEVQEILDKLEAIETDHGPSS